MSLYSIKTENLLNVTNWVKETKKRGQENSIMKNPFYWKFKTIKTKKDLIIVIDARPVLPNFSFMGWFCGAVFLILWGVSALLIPCIFVGCMGIFWTADFLFFMTKRALRKQGYKGPIKRIKHADLIREVIL